jgi:hypothetical protein
MQSLFFRFPTELGLKETADLLRAYGYWWLSVPEQTFATTEDGYDEKAVGRKKIGGLA